MSTHIATAGNIEVVKKGLAHFKGITNIYILTTKDNPISHENYNIIIVDKSDPSTILQAIINIAEKEKDIYINITGGTNAMAAGALLGAYYTGAKAYYVTRDKTIMLPVPQVSIINQFRRDKKISSLFSEIKRQHNVNDKVMQKLISNKKPQIISKQIKKLEKLGLIKTITEGRDKQIEITNIGMLY